MTWEGLNPPYSTIVADPPWEYEGFALGPGHGTLRPRMGWDSWGKGYESEVA